MYKIIYVSKEIDDQIKKWYIGTLCIIDHNNRNLSERSHNNIYQDLLETTNYDIRLVPSQGGSARPEGISASAPGATTCSGQRGGVSKC
jgi:hypothetical protein